MNQFPGTAEAKAADITSHLIPNSFVVPAMVGEISRLGLKGYPLVFVPKEF
jgi:hypothetical protein